MAFTDRDEQFARQLTACQSRLYAYISAMVPDPERAHDVLQQANVVMLRKCDDYEPGQDFVAWACKVAYFEALAARRDHARDRLKFSDRFFECIAAAAAERTAGFDRRQAALVHCMDKLPDEQRTLLRRRYGRGGSVKLIAETMGQSVAAISQSLYRIRQALAQCIRRTLAEEDA